MTRFTYPLLDLDRPTKTGRLYSTAVVEQTIRRLTKAQQRMFYGVIGVPDGLPGTLPLDKASHLVHNLRIEGSQLLGDIEPMNTPHGSILQTLIERKAVKFRTNGFVGLVPNTSAPEVVSDLILVSINALPAQENEDARHPRLVEQFTA